ncbi:hypothetical protein DTO207G8_4255 [Paecilomyces variotii]|nr:hypothetical protein DTO207G8_4255 [Paecilomyces variotii]KAJ9306418.1 hypothetical protein DTO217A2_4157 [Paecilomyces variotii]
MQCTSTQKTQPLALGIPYSWLSELEPLETASAVGDIGTLRTFFLKRQNDFFSNPELLRSLSPALSVAVTNDKTACVTYLLDRGVPMNQELFLYATKRKSYPILQAFLEHGWDINTPTSRLIPPALAYTFSDESLMYWFLDHGADPSASCGRDCTPLSFAVMYAPFSAVRALFSRANTIQSGQLVHYAAQRELSDRVEVLTFLLENGGSSSINKVMYQDCLEDYLQNMYAGIGTPLQLAAGKGLSDLVKLLVDRGADPLIKDPRGKLALDWALESGHTDIVEFLRPFSIPSHVDRHDFVDEPGLHFKPLPLKDFLKMGEWKAVFHP